MCACVRLCECVEDDLHACHICMRDLFQLFLLKVLLFKYSSLVLYEPTSFLQPWHTLPSPVSLIPCRKVKWGWLAKQICKLFGFPVSYIHQKVFTFNNYFLFSYSINVRTPPWVHFDVPQGCWGTDLRTLAMFNKPPPQPAGENPAFSRSNSVMNPLFQFWYSPFSVVHACPLPPPPPILSISLS